MSSQTDPQNPYAAVHANPQGEGDARPTALQIIKDENLINKMTDKVMLVTGASSGIGIETVRALHATGAHILMGVRDMKRGQEVLDSVKSSSEGTGEIDLLFMELDSFASIRAAVDEFLKKSGKLNVLVNNAGIRNPPEGKTKDGHETQFGTNHLGHFLLTHLLLPTLISSSSPSFASRVVNVTSGAHRRGPLHFDNLTLKGIYTPRLAYAQSKTANVLMVNELNRRYGGRGVNATSACPGVIKTRALRYDDPQELDKLLPTLEKLLKTPEQGAATQVWAAVSVVWEGKGGLYLEDCGVGTETKDWNTRIRGGYAGFVFDPEAEKRLWEVSCDLVGVKSESV